MDLSIEYARQLGKLQAEAKFMVMAIDYVQNNYDQEFEGDSGKAWDLIGEIKEKFTDILIEQGELVEERQDDDGEI